MNVGIIPARLHSTRFPKKILSDINGKPMVIHTAMQAQKSKKLDRIIIAIDDDETFEKISGFNFEVIMTSKNHKSGTDRVAEVVKNIENVDVVVNIQADEPFIDPILIDLLVESFKDKNIHMSTLVSTKLSLGDLEDSSIVKAFISKDMFATDFVRHCRDRIGGVYKHLGIYAFTKNALLDFVSYEQTPEEKKRSLEQIRALDNNIPIKSIITDKDVISINTVNDYILAKGALK